MFLILDCFHLIKPTSSVCIYLHQVGHVTAGVYLSVYLTWKVMNRFEWNVHNRSRNWWFRFGDVRGSGGTLTFDLIKILGQNERPRGIDQLCHITLYSVCRHICRARGDYAPESSERKCALLTQVPGHQVGVVEILHAQSNDVDEFLDDLHELHRPGIDLHKRI